MHLQPPAIVFVSQPPCLAPSRWRRGDRAGPVRPAPCRTIGIGRAVCMAAGARAAAFVREQSRLRAVAAPRSWLLSTNRSRPAPASEAIALSANEQPAVATVLLLLVLRSGKARAIHWPSAYTGGCADLNMYAPPASVRRRATTRAPLLLRRIAGLGSANSETAQFSMDKPELADCQGSPPSSHIPKGRFAGQDRRRAVRCSAGGRGALRH